MRRASRHGLAGATCRYALVAALVVSLAPASPGHAALLGEGEGSSSSLPSTNALPSLHVQAGSLLNIEAGSGPTKVEAPGVATVETPPLPGVEAPSPPPVETPSLPVETPTTPTVGTPSPSPTGASSSPTQPASGAAGAGPAADTSASAARARQSSASDGEVATASSVPGGVARPSSGGAFARAGARVGAARRRSASGGKPLLLPVASTSGQGGSADAAHSARPRADHAAAASDPLDTIGRQIPFPVPVPDWSKPIILGLLLLAIALAIRSALVTRRARGLAAQNATILSDLDEMQKALVPAVPGRLGGLALSVAYRPADGPAAGGDFYDLFALEAARVAIVLGDVVGHGREAVAQAALTRYTLRAYLQAGLEPRAALALAGSVLATPGEKRFATVVIAVHDGATGRLTYACAGHPPPIAVGFNAPEPITVCCSAPICCDLPTGRRQTTLSLPWSGGMCFFSDGLPEARTGDGLLGRERLEAILDELGPSVTAPVLLERVRREAPSVQDDMVACVASAAVRVPATASQLEELEVDPEMLEEPRVCRFLEACGFERAQVGATLVQARELAGAEGRALLEVERPYDGAPTVRVKPCVAAPGPAAVAEAVRSLEPALAVPSGP